MPANLYEPGNFHVKGSVEAEGGFTSGGHPVVVGGAVGGFWYWQGQLNDGDAPFVPTFTAQADLGGPFLNPQDTTQLIIPKSGLYLVNSQYSVNTSPVAGYVRVFDVVNGSDDTDMSVQASPDYFATTQYTFVSPFSAGDVFTWRIEIHSTVPGSPLGPFVGISLALLR